MITTCVRWPAKSRHPRFSFPRPLNPRPLAHQRAAAITVYGVTLRVDERRRAFLRAALTVPAAGLIITSCTSDRAPRATPYPLPDGDARIRWQAVRTEQRLLALYAATLEKHPGLDDQLGPVVAHHEDHLETILADGPLPIAAEGVAPPGVGDVPGNRDDARNAIRKAEREASDGHAERCVAAGPLLAALLGSAAASEAAHAVVLA